MGAKPVSLQIKSAGVNGVLVNLAQEMTLQQLRMQSMAAVNLGLYYRPITSHKPGDWGGSCKQIQCVAACCNDVSLVVLPATVQSITRLPCVGSTPGESRPTTHYF